MSQGTFSPATGGCLCGKSRFRITTKPLLASACHCRGCQKLTGSAYSLSLTIASEGFEVTSGQAVIGALHKADARYWFCDWCKCWLYTQPPPEVGLVNVRTTLLDEPAGFDPYLEVWTSEKLPWAQTPARHSYESAPSIEVYRSMIEEYARL